MDEPWRETIMVETPDMNPDEAWRQAVEVSKIRRLGVDPDRMPFRWDVHLIGVARVVTADGGGGGMFIWTFEARE